jgi:ribonucleoside-triphosphate reductase
MMDLAMHSLERKRVVVEANIQNGMLPWTKRYLPRGLMHHFSTIGLVGMNEASLMMTGSPISNQNGEDFAAWTLGFMSDRIKHYQQRTEHIYNLEESPAEATSWTMADYDRHHHRGITTAGERHPFYTNSSHLPVDCDLPFNFQIQHQERLQEYYTGGTVYHHFIGEANPSPEGIKKLVRRISENTRIKNFTMTPTYSACDDHGRIGGEVHECPTCRKPTQIYSRVTGYIRAVSSWNPGKREEFRLRKTFKSPF